MRWVDVGGGIGVVDRPGGVPIDLAAINTHLQVALSLSHPAASRASHPRRCGVVRRLLGRRCRRLR